jgi:hypothetical protein
MLIVIPDSIIVYVFNVPASKLKSCHKHCCCDIQMVENSNRFKNLILFKK